MEILFKYKNINELMLNYRTRNSTSNTTEQIKDISTLLFKHIKITKIEFFNTKIWSILSLLVMPFSEDIGKYWFKYTRTRMILWYTQRRLKEHVKILKEKKSNLSMAPLKNVMWSVMAEWPLPLRMFKEIEVCVGMKKGEAAFYQVRTCLLRSRQILFFFFWWNEMPVTSHLLTRFTENTEITVGFAMKPHIKMKKGLFTGLEKKNDGATDPLSRKGYRKDTERIERTSTRQRHKNKLYKSDRTAPGDIFRDLVAREGKLRQEVLEGEGRLFLSKNIYSLVDFLVFSSLAKSETRTSICPLPYQLGIEIKTIDDRFVSKKKKTFFWPKMGKDRMKKRVWNFSTSTNSRNSLTEKSKIDFISGSTGNNKDNITYGMYHGMIHLIGFKGVPSATETVNSTNYRYRSIDYENDAYGEIYLRCFVKMLMTMKTEFCYNRFNSRFYRTIPFCITTRKNENNSQWTVFAVMWEILRLLKTRYFRLTLNKNETTSENYDMMSQLFYQSIKIKLAKPVIGIDEGKEKKKNYPLDLRKFKSITNYLNLSEPECPCYNNW
ncbi:hypothetical protein H8356DRAFT_1436276 [Neocallimastix lanati (nom. inval.)]|nr:hypothetical protein H8356DRAFT_1436276 [Neocallimastix sp. JGI-2020a]